MSEEQLNAFLEAAKADADLREKLNSAADPSALVAIAKEAGFDISLEGLGEFVDAEITDKELERVTGGGTRCVTKTPFKSLIKM